MPAIARVLAFALVVGLAAACTEPGSANIVIGEVPPEPAIEALAPDPAAAGGLPDPGLRYPDGYGPRGALEFRGAVDVPPHLLFFLVIGSDARPGQDVERSRADAISIVAVDPVTRRGTILGLPRDSWVEVPGRGTRKINSALALGGPELLARTVRNLTGLPISYYAVTGFEGMVTMVDALGGLDVHVTRRMNDRNSGARFEPGWHHMNGHEVLAFTRDRGSGDGTFTRAENHGRVILHTLEKMRAETSDEAGIRAWLDVLFRHARLDIGFGDALRLGKLARTLDPAGLQNVVVPGRSGRAGGQSVVFLGEPAYRLFRDVGADAVADGRELPPSPTPEPTPPSPPPTATPPPSPSPTPAPLPTPAVTPTPSPSATPSPTPTPWLLP